jgi:hypothetical protein
MGEMLHRGFHAPLIDETDLGPNLMASRKLRCSIHQQNLECEMEKSRCSGSGWVKSVHRLSGLDD